MDWVASEREGKGNMGDGTELMRYAASQVMS